MHAGGAGFEAYSTAPRRISLARAARRRWGHGFDLLPDAAKQGVRILGDLVTLAVLAPVVWLGWESARSLDIMHAISLGAPLSAFAYPVPVAGGLSSVRSVRVRWPLLSWRVLDVRRNAGPF